MKVIAIDPGYDRVGVAVLERVGSVETLLFSTCITTDKKESFSERLQFIGDTLKLLLAEYQPQLLAIETLFFNKNVKTAIAVAQARGVVLYLAKTAQCEVLELSPQQVKVSVTGYGGSDKTAVIAMVQRLIKNVPTKAYDDEYDAIAVGITALAYRRE